MHPTNQSRVSPLVYFLVGTAVILFVLAVSVMFVWYLWKSPPAIPLTKQQLEELSLFATAISPLGTVFAALGFAGLVLSLALQSHSLKVSLRQVDVAVQQQLEATKSAQETVQGQLAQMRAMLFAISEREFVAIERSLKDVPGALRFHGITADELKKAALTAEEFAYLSSVFTAGGLHVRAASIAGTPQPTNEPFPTGSYFHSLLSTPEVRHAWPVLTKMLSSSPFKHRIELTIQAIKHDAAAKPERS